MVDMPNGLGCVGRYHEMVATGVCMCLETLKNAFVFQKTCLFLRPVVSIEFVPSDKSITHIYIYIYIYTQTRLQYDIHST